MEKSKRIPIVDTIFIVVIFILTTNSIKEMIGYDFSILKSIIVGLIGAVVWLGITYVFRGKSNATKIFAMVTFSVIVLGLSYFLTQSSSSFLEGKWEAKQDSLKLQVIFSKDSVNIISYPDKNQMKLSYKVIKDTIDFKNEDEEKYFKWKVISHSQDSLIVKYENEIVKFVKMTQKL